MDNEILIEYLESKGIDRDNIEFIYFDFDGYLNYSFFKLINEDVKILENDPIIQYEDKSWIDGFPIFSYDRLLLERKRKLKRLK